ncbi:MAG TPA: PepSY domain-containing protein [Burkholderiales bacterium]
MKHLLPAVALVCVALLSDPAAADRNRWARDDPPAYAPHSTRDARISLEQAIRTVQRATGGRVLDARAVAGGYRIKVLTQRGEVRVVHVDAQTGEMR